jgi:hypothetical protein
MRIITIMIQISNLSLIWFNIMTEKEKILI